MREKDREAMNTMHCIEVSTTGKLNEVDIESGEVLYPGLSKGENQLRWGFIRKVYDILSSQLLLTTAISFVTVLHTPVKDEMEMAKAGGEVVVEKSNTCEECGASFKKPAYLKKPMQSHSPEIHDKLKELQSILKFDEGSCKSDLKEISRRHTSRSPLKIGESQSINEKASILMHFMVRDFMKLIECTPFHEIVCYRNVENLQSPLIGDSRKMIQVDLLEFHKTLQCSCCRKSDNIPLPSMPDTSIMYTLAQEHGDLINLHDWFQSLKTIVIQYSRKGTSKLEKFPLKERKERNESENKSEASIQLRLKCKGWSSSSQEAQRDHSEKEVGTGGQAVGCSTRHTRCCCLGTTLCKYGRTLVAKFLSIATI